MCRVIFPPGILAAIVIVAAAIAGSDDWGKGDDAHFSLPLQVGDIVLRKGTGFWGVLFARVNPRDSRFSHAGIVVEDGGRWRVVHAEADNFGADGRVRLDDWHEFVYGVSRLAVLRLEDQAAAGRTADAALDMYRAGMAFDFDFNLARSDAVYCTELVWRSLMQALGRDPLPVKPLVNGREVVLVENFLLDIADLTLVEITMNDNRNSVRLVSANNRGRTTFY